MISTKVSSFFKDKVSPGTIDIIFDEPIPDINNNYYDNSDNDNDDDVNNEDNDDNDDYDTAIFKDTLCTWRTYICHLWT